MPKSSLGWTKICAFFGLSAGILSVSFLTAAPAGSGVYESPVASLIKLGMKFDGAGACSADKCHGGAAPGATKGLDAFTKWSGKDKHSKSFDALSNDTSKKIAAALKIDDATTSDRCLSCHSMNVPANLQGKKFDIREGNSCDTCHGPSEKWLEPHSKEGWGDEQRKAAASHEALLKQWGLYDTRPLVARADRCTSCHLAIEADLIKAGHPTPVFELAYYSNPQVYEDRHWSDPKENYYDTKQWAAGQIVCLRDAMKQLNARASGGADADAVKDAADQAAGHLAGVQALAAAGGVDGGINAAADQFNAAGTDNAKLAAAASTIADWAEKQMDAVSKWTPDQAANTKALQSLANSDVAKNHGLHGAEQQILGIYSLYNAYVTAASPADANATMDAIGSMFDVMDKKKVGDSYFKSLETVKSKLPK